MGQHIHFLRVSSGASQQWLPRNELLVKCLRESQDSCSTVEVAAPNNRSQHQKVSPAYKSCDICIVQEQLRGENTVRVAKQELKGSQVKVMIQVPSSETADGETQDPGNTRLCGGGCFTILRLLKYVVITEAREENIKSQRHMFIH